MTDKMKYCIGCKNEKPLDEFVSENDFAQCKDCRTKINARIKELNRIKEEQRKFKPLPRNILLDNFNGWF